MTRNTSISWAPAESRAVEWLKSALDSGSILSAVFSRETLFRVIGGLRSIRVIASRLIEHVSGANEKRELFADLVIGIQVEKGRCPVVGERIWP